MKTTSAITLAAALFTVPAISSAEQPMSFIYEVQVDIVDDQANLLGGAVQMGDILSGSYIYDLDAVDESSSTTFGKYQYTTAPYGMIAHVGGLTFQTEPSTSGPWGAGFAVQVIDNTDDRLYVTSFSNKPLGANVYVEKIEIQLTDSSGYSFSSDAQPVSAPHIPNFVQRQFTIKGGDCVGDSYYCNNSFMIMGTITSISADVGGVSTGLDVESVVCHNVTTGQTATILNSPGWNCNSAGLLTNSGDRIVEMITGTVK